MLPKILAVFCLLLLVSSVELENQNSHRKLGHRPPWRPEEVCVPYYETAAAQFKRLHRYFLKNGKVKYPEHYTEDEK